MTDSETSDRRQELLEGVIRYLAEHGAANASLRQMAASMGTSTYSLSYHFGSKDQLLGAVISELEARQRALAEQPGDSGMPVELWRWYVDHPELLRLELDLLLDESRDHGAERERPGAALGFHYWHQLWERRLVAAGYPPTEAETRATLLIANAIGLQIDMLATGDTSRTTDAFSALRERARALLAGPA